MISTSTMLRIALGGTDRGTCRKSVFIVVFAFVGAALGRSEVCGPADRLTMMHLIAPNALRGQRVIADHRRAIYHPHPQPAPGRTVRRAVSAEPGFTLFKP
ncbi:MAG: hypothetical protein KAS72_07870 [Phycisphaerales bacterium]|nr:hypothetical protein [Phycisphaerales bacterium]